MDATPENGCMEILPGVLGHGLLEHHSKAAVGTTIIPDALPDANWLPTIPPVVPRLWYGPPTRAELPLRVWADTAGAPPGTGDAARS